ncbi:hypothetical protein D3C72_1692130 [compost metagenome]
MPVSLRVAHAPLRGIHVDDAGVGVQVVRMGPGIGQQRKQRAALHADAVQMRIQAGIAHFHHGAAAGRVAIQPSHRRAVREDLRQQLHLPQHIQATGLEQETGTDRSGCGGTFEDVHVVMVA